MARRGPRPLPLHLSLAAMRGWAAMSLPPPGRAPAHGSTSSSGAWPRSSAGRAEAARIGRALAAGGHPPEAFAAAVWRALLRGDRALLAGIAAYRRHPWRRDLPDPPVAWAEGASRLLDYGGPLQAAPAVVFVPSLVNRAHVLDLMPGGSLLRFLAARGGARPLLLDWGWPGAQERGLGLTDLLAGRLERALGAACALAGGPVVLAGYCMGGLLALAAALRRPERVRALALLATPWDFWAGPGDAAGRARGLAGMLPALEPVMEATGTLPVDALQALFAALDPFGVAEKYRAFARLDPVGPAARRFVALEDWLNDGVPLAAPVARECLGGWYGANTPARLAWQVAGMPVDPRGWAGPALVAVPARDRIVPPASAEPLTRLIPRAEAIRPAAGHIGMVAGGGAERALWRPLEAWIAALGPG